MIPDASQDRTTTVADQQIARDAATTWRVSGRYEVAVDRLADDGLAQGTIRAVLHAPAEEDWARVSNGRSSTPIVGDAIAVIGGLAGEVLDVELSWPLPYPGRKPAKRVPAPAVRVLSVARAAPERVVPRCGVFGECGGCQVQHLAYPAQLAWKTARVRRQLEIVGFADAPVRPALDMPDPWNYRNHMRFSVDRRGHAGLTARGTHRVLPLSACPIAHPRINDALRVLETHPLARPQVVLRYGEATGQLLMQPAPSQAQADMLCSVGLDVRADMFDEALLGERFHVRPSSFFQTNSAQANRMAELVLERLPSGPDVTLVDAYCGVGTFARLLARRVGRVVAVEESASAVRDARANVGDLPNVEIVQAKVEDWLPATSEPLDGLVIDPPRAGCKSAVLDALSARRVPVVVYVSCDPATLARDLARLCLNGAPYRLASVQPLDMFPQTAHIENVALLELA